MTFGIQRNVAKPAAHGDESGENGEIKRYRSTIGTVAYALARCLPRSMTRVRAWVTELDNKRSAEKGAKREIWAQRIFLEYNVTLEEARSYVMCPEFKISEPPAYLLRDERKPFNRILKEINFDEIVREKITSLGKNYSEPFTDEELKNIVEKIDANISRSKELRSKATSQVNAFQQSGGVFSAGNPTVRFSDEQIDAIKNQISDVNPFQQSGGVTSTGNYALGLTDEQTKAVLDQSKKTGNMYADNFMESPHFSINH